MYIPVLEGFGVSTLPAIQLTNLLLQKAVRLNHCMSEWLDWGQYRKDIENLLKLTKKNPTALEFATAVSQWQKKHSLQVDGILGLSTLNSMHKVLGRPSLAGEPERPSWIEWVASPNHHDRQNAAVDMIIYHATGGQELGPAINTFTNKKSGVSAHYVIDREGRIIQMVPLDRAAQHYPPYNRRSVGIEIVNPNPRYDRGKAVKMCKKQGKGNLLKTCQEWEKVKPVLGRKDYYRYEARSWLSKNEYWVPYSEKQYQSLIRLTRFLVSCIPSITYITGHEHLLSWKKEVKKEKVRYSKDRNDPGGAFDWERIKRDLPSWFKGRVCHREGRYIKGTKKINSKWKECFDV